MTDSGPGEGVLDWYPAPAKLNLFLHVLGRRVDGYHLLQTVFRLVSLYDEVGIASRTDGEISRVDTTPGVASEDDLCVRAARILRECALTEGMPGADRLGARLGLRKQIPIGGGLGGGSSDAATVLLVLNRLWGLGLGRRALMALGLRLGADVPVFILGANALGEGVGERLTPIPLDPAWYLILIPQVSVSTKEIFSSPALTRDTKPLKMSPFLPSLGHNDLQPVAMAMYPQISGYLDWLLQRKNVRLARMTGSGACVFAEFGQEADAREAAAQLPGHMQGLVVQGLERHPLQNWAAEV